MIVRLMGPISLALLSGATLPASAAEPPARLCARVTTDDTLRPIPASLVPAATRAFGLRAPAATVQATTVFRCADRRVMLCATGANLACGKADRRDHLAAADRYCRANPGSAAIPMVVTGHGTIHTWRCAGKEAVAGPPARSLDPRGFDAALWKPAGSR